MTQSGWQFWIDRGGTFTDLVARAPSGRLHSMKLLSDAPDQYRDAAAESIRRILEKFGSRDDPITEIRMGTTVATNALLERSGPATALIINDGFADVLRIGNQQRPDIFSLDIRRPAPLYSRVIEVAGRLDADGHELEALNLAAAEQSFRKLAMAGIASVAICLMHAWKSARHELQLAELARRVGFAHVSVSHQVSPLMKLVERGVTTVADAYLSPVLKDYVQQFQQALAENDMSCARLLFMQSNGGLVSPAFF